MLTGAGRLLALTVPILATVTVTLLACPTPVFTRVKETVTTLLLAPVPRVSTTLLTETLGVPFGSELTVMAAVPGVRPLPEAVRVWLPAV